MGNTMADNIGTIFGSSFLSSLTPISITIDVEAEDNPEVEVEVEVEVEFKAQVDVEVEKVSNVIEDSSQITTGDKSGEGVIETGR
jgi:Protein of unknown function (DUF3194)